MKTLLLFFLSCTMLISFGQDYSQKFTDVNYAGDNQSYHNLDIYLPAEGNGPFPVIVYIYGSAWMSNSGKGADMTTVGAALLDAGYAVVTPNHRSSSDAIFPAQINDIKAVVRFVRGTASTYNFDTSFIGISGSSSGGHLASLTGTSVGVETYTVGSASADIEGSVGNYTEYSSSVDAVVDWFGPTDLKVISSCPNGDGYDHDGDNSPGSMIIGAPITQNPDKADLLNPITYVDPTDPPFLEFHGTVDKVVPYCQSELLDAALDAAGVPSEYISVPGGDHGGGVTQSPANLATMVSFFNDVKDSMNSGYALTVTGGSGSGNYEENASVTVVASDAPDGKAFSKWTGDGASLLSNTSAATVTFTMPANDVTLTATYIDAFTVTIISPSNGASVAAGGSVNVQVTASTSDIQNIEFLDGTTKLGEDESAPYSFVWSNIQEGKQVLTVKATDNGGITVTKTITINGYIPQAPYGGVAHAIPGVIELEEYDTGGPDSAYVDGSEGNEGGADFRTDEDVDIEDCTDTGKGYNIGFATADEWTEYTVNVKATGTYKLHLRAACDGTGRTIAIAMDGNVIDNSIEIPNTGGWQIWETVTIDNVELQAGTQVMRMTIGSSSYVNLNFVEFEAVAIEENDPIELSAGWNLIGYPFSGSANIEDALSDIWQYVECVKNMDEYYLSSQADNLNTLKQLEWGHGYFIKVSDACTLEW